MEYVAHLLIVIEIYAIIAIGLNTAIGDTGLLSMAQAAFVGVGAYASALLTIGHIVSLAATLLTGVLSAACVAGAVGLAATRIRGDYFAVLTLSCQLVVFSILNNWDGVTGGPVGLPGIPHPSVAGFQLAAPKSFILLSTGCLATVYWIAASLSHSSVGRALRAVREDEIFARSRGVNVFHLKLAAFVFSGACAGLAGYLYSSYYTYIDPTSFSVSESIGMISIVIVGGAGRVIGAVLGACVFVMFPELLRFVGLPTVLAAEVRQGLYGLILVALMVWHPEGLLGRYRLGR